MSLLSVSVKHLWVLCIENPLYLTYYGLIIKLQLLLLYVIKLLVPYSVKLFFPSPDDLIIKLSLGRPVCVCFWHIQLKPNIVI
jgi:hypothetical protein